ncbi:MAG: AsmA-like C-terminal region-containing protein, partial [Acidobacteriota bacterium]
PVSNVVIRITRYGARLSPAQIGLAPGVQIVAEGVLRHISSRRTRRRIVRHPTYELTLYSHTVNLRNLLEFGRALDIAGTKRLEVQGIGSLTLHLTGAAWPLSKPSLTATANVRSARLKIPGLREPLNIPRARIQVYDKQIIVNPLLAVMGTSVFSGWVMHRRGSHEPWNFNLKADHLSIRQAAQWFDGIGNQAPTSFFARLSDLSSLISGRHPSFRLADDLDVRGHFATSLVTYRALSLREFRASVEIYKRKVHLTNVRFDAAGGHGKASAMVDLTRTPAQISGRVSVAEASIQALGSYLPPALSTARGHYSAEGEFEARGLTRVQIAPTLRGRATVRFRDVNLGSFNPIGILARRSGMEVVEEGSQPRFLPEATAHLEVRGRRVILQDFPVELSGAKFKIRGSYAFDGSASLRVLADLRGIRQSWVPVRPHDAGTISRMADIRFAGTLRDLEMVPPPQISQTQP